MPVNPGPSEMQLIMDSVRFFGWLLGSICTLAVTLLGIYLRLYVRDALNSHTVIIQNLIAKNYVRKDVHEEQMNTLKVLMGGAG